MKDNHILQFQHSYSHGLEAIYTLENVDPKTIRPFQKPEKQVCAKKKALQPQLLDNPQISIDFGIGFRDWIEPLILHEPIQVLELSRFVEKNLLENGVVKLRDLVSNRPIKGIGLGQRDEINHKLKEYLYQKPIEKSSSIDLLSFIKVLAFDGVRKKMAECLKKYRLDDGMSLLPSEAMEMKRMTPQGLKEWDSQALEELRHESKQRLVYDKVKEIAEALIKPWMRQRQGIVSEYDLLERLERVVIQPELLDNFLDFFGDVYHLKSSLFINSIPSPAQGVYCVDEWHCQAYQAIIKKTETYFYKKGISYSLETLIGWISREFAKEWVGFPDGMIEKALALSQFSLRQGLEGKVIVSAC